MARKGYDINEWLTPEGKIRIEGMCRDGALDKDIYAAMGVSRTTFYKWKATNDEFADLLKRNKEVVDREVENALLEAAMAGNTTAQIFWLKNRKPDMWQDRKQQDIKITTPIAETAMKVEEILRGEEDDE